MSGKTCGSCLWWEDFILADEDEPARGTCTMPAKLMPLCMQGVAQREREIVPANAATCPTHEGT